MQDRIKIRCNDSLQMNAAALLVQKASNFKSSIYIIHDNRRANAKSLLGIMSLGIDENIELDLEAEGDDAKDALAALAEVLHAEIV